MLDDKTDGEAASDFTAIKRSSSNGLVITFGFQISRFALQFVSAIVMSRLLSPAEFGIVAMAYPIIAFLQLFVDLGLTQATIQRSNISQSELSFMFWVCVTVSFVMGAALIALAPVAGSFYREPRVTGVIVALGLITMLGGFYSQHAALLNRRLRFLQLGIADVGGYVIGAMCGITAAFGGMSYWSVVIAQAATTISSLLLHWLFAAWIPSRPRWVTNAPELLGFGGNVTTFNIVNYFARNFDNILIGRYAGEVQLGLYDRAYRLLILPLSQVTQPLAKVATPLLARMLEKPDQYRHSYARMLEIALLLTYPAVIFAGIERHDLVLTMLGPKWMRTADIFGILAIGALFAPVSNSTGWLLTTQNRTREMRDYGLISSIAFVLSFITGLPWQALGVATCYIIVGSVQGPMLWWATTRRGPVSARDLVAVLIPFVQATLVTGLLLFAAKDLTDSNILSLLVQLIASYAIFISSFAITSRGRDTLCVIVRQMIHMVSSVRHKVLS